jgi:CRP/FNR family cyclic AMP-dependent transcriptional regulator
MRPMKSEEPELQAWRDGERQRGGSFYLELLAHHDFREGEHWEQRHYRSQEFVLKQGERSGKLFLVLRGLVRVVGYVEVGPDSHVRPGVKDLGAGEIFGEISLFDQGVHKAGILAVAETDVVAIDGAALLALFDEHPELGYRFFRSLTVSLAQRLRSADQQIFHLLGWALKAHGYEPYLKDN